MKQEYEKLIAEQDRVLSMLRDGWLKAPEKDQAQWLGRIDAMLDERLRLMKLRDEAVVTVQG